ncbi:unnamed protein product, partial [Mesorhabditis belari]|uniref:Tartrate-resistant acid phosphatase type 5 n=1 Tax=Mesorhabditis belari TaxID=2138241 RepID=A0AAF3FEA9_9BILA
MQTSSKPSSRQNVISERENPHSTSGGYFCVLMTQTGCCLGLAALLYITLTIGTVEILSLFPKTRAYSQQTPPVVTAEVCSKGSKGCTQKDSALRFLLIGDTGGLPIYPYTTLAQGTVRDTMIRLTEQNKVQLVLNVGDNIYFTGVANEFDARFETSFEEVYNHPIFDGIPFFTIAGNHDHFGNVSAQIAYTKYSRKWMYPDYWYKFNYTLSDGTTIDFLMIDTIVLCGNTADVEYGDLWDLLWKGSKVPDGPKDKKMAEKQWDWIAKTLNESRADYLFVGGHYPVFSMSSHGPTQCLVDRLKPLLEQFSVTAYFAGHDHTLQHLEVPTTDRHSHITYIVSGAASRTDRSTKHKNSVPQGSIKFNYPSGWNPFSQLGFSRGALIYVEINKDRAKFDFLKGNGESKYTMSLMSRKRSVKLDGDEEARTIEL